MATDGLGLLRVKETYFSAAICTALSLTYGTRAWGLPGIRSPYCSLYLALEVFCVAGEGFAAAALTPLSPRYDGVKHFYEKHGRRIIIADMQLTMVSLAFLWLAVVGEI